MMIDSLVRLLPEAEQCKVNGFSDGYALDTLRHAANVDAADVQVLINLEQRFQQALQIKY